VVQRSQRNPRPNLGDPIADRRRRARGRLCLAIYGDGVDEVLDARTADAHSGIPASLAAVKRIAEG